MVSGPFGEGARPQDHLLQAASGGSLFDLFVSISLKAGWLKGWVVVDIDL
jgi:hypothetical protein